MVETLQNLQHIYARWESKNPWQGGANPARSSAPERAPTSEYQRVLSSGRQAWRNKFSNMPPPPVRRTKHKNRGFGSRTSSIEGGGPASSTIASFKTHPIVVPVIGRHRPFMGRCCTCLPQSRTDLYDDSYKHGDLLNLFNVSTKSHTNNFLVRKFCYFTFTMQRDVNHKYPDVSKAVLDSKRVKDAIEKAVQEEQDENPKMLSEKQIRALVRKTRTRARNVLNYMKCNISNALVRLTGWVLHRTFGRLLSGIVVHQGQIDMLKKAMHKDVPVILLPTHRSHVDYLLVTFILWNYDIGTAPHVAAGNNLMIPVFGEILRGLGGFFIRRKLDKHGKKDHVYRAVLHTYMHELLKNNENMEFFIEGGRTRSGKALYPKGGLLSVVVDTFNEGIIPDILIVPISISYDKLLDGNFVKEQMGTPKEPETFWKACKSIYKVFMSHFGYVRVDFAQAFSLREYLQVSQNFSQDCFVDSDTSGSECELSLSLNKRRGSETSLYGMDVVMEEERMRNMVQGLAEHIVYKQIDSQAIMCTQFVAFLMLCKFREGAHIASVIRGFDWLKQEIVNRNRDLGFTGKSIDVIREAVNLNPELISLEPCDGEEQENGEVEFERSILKPVTTLPNVFDLYYYSNVVTSVFSLEAVLAISVYSLGGEGAWTDQCKDDKITISQSALINRASHLCHLLKYEYIFKPPCQSLESVLRDGIEQLQTNEILLRDEDRRVYLDQREKSLGKCVSNAMALDDDDSDDDFVTDFTYMVNRESEQSMGIFQFLRSVIGPLIECYYVCACHLTELQEQDYVESELHSRIHGALKERVETGVATYAESAALDTIKNCFHGLEHIKIITRVAKDVPKPLVTLSQKYKNEPEKLDRFIALMESCHS